MQYVHGNTGEKRRLNAYSRIRCSPPAPRLFPHNLPTLLSLSFRAALHGPKACRLSGCSEAGSSRGATGSQVHNSAQLCSTVLSCTMLVMSHSTVAVAIQPVPLPTSREVVPLSSLTPSPPIPCLGVVPGTGWLWISWPARSSRHRVL
jgi:hypothetical protein